jgi:PKD repeat protein
MIRLNTPIESLVINLQSAGNVQYNVQYVIVRQGTRLEKSTEGLLTSSGQNVVLINDFSSGYFDITYINVTNIDPTENFISVLKKTNVSEFNLTSEAIGLKNRECTEFTSESGFKVLDQNGSFKTITESVSADGDVENSDMTYMASVPSGGTLTLPDSDIEVNGVGEGVVVSVKTISVDLNDGTDPVNPTLVTLVGNTLTITLPDIGDVTLENSDATYQVIEPSGGTLVLPDSQINFNGVDQGDVVSVKTINVDLTDGVDPIVPTSVGLVGNTLTITLPASSDVDIEINGVPFDTITAPATVDIPVINSVPVPVGTIVGTDVVVGDATVNVRKSDATLINAVTVEAEGVASYNVADSTAVIKDSAGTTLKSEGILAATSENITINDSTAVIKDSIGTTLKTEPILAEASENITINNSTVNIRDTAANLLHAVSVRAEATTTQDIADTTVENSDASYSVNVLAEGSLTLPDSQINVNSVDSGDVVSVKTIDVNLEDSLGAPVTPTSVGLVGNTLTIEVPSGATPMNVDFSANKLTALQGENIAFTDLSDQSPTHWSWLFSDGTTSNVQNPVKNFLTIGLKNITLLAGKVGAGGVAIKNSYIEIFVTYFTDLFGVPSAAYSLRKLSPNSLYSGAAIRVRRSSDNTEQDINFVSSTANATIDTTSLLSFVGAGNGFVVTWYNQNGSGNHVTQSTAANQPQIVSSGSLILENSKPSIQFDGSNDSLISSVISTDIFTNSSIFSVLKIPAQTSEDIPFGFGETGLNGGVRVLYSSTGKKLGFATWAIDYTSSVDTISTNIYLYSVIQNGTIISLKKNNTTATGTLPSTPSNTTTGAYSIGSLFGSSIANYYTQMNGSEFIFYGSEQSTNRALIETNINDYYGIF